MTFRVMLDGEVEREFSSIGEALTCVQGWIADGHHVDMLLPYDAERMAMVHIDDDDVEVSLIDSLITGT